MRLNTLVLWDGLWESGENRIMRQQFGDQLAEAEDRLLGELYAIGQTLESIGDSLLDRSCGMSRLADASARLRRASRQADDRLVAVAARQAPVAGDLRRVLCLVELAHHASLIANQFGLIGEQVGLLDADACDVQQSGHQLSLMTALVGREIQHAVLAFAGRDVESAVGLERQDEALDHLNRQIFEAARGLDGNADDRELALRYVLIARCLERVGDNAVDIAEETVFLVTGQLTEFSDASHPKSKPSAG